MNKLNVVKLKAEKPQPGYMHIPSYRQWTIISPYTTAKGQWEGSTRSLGGLYDLGIVPMLKSNKQEIKRFSEKGA